MMKPKQFMSFGDALHLILIFGEQAARSIQVLEVIRATFATRAVDCGMEPAVLKTILGHSKISTTMDLYYHALLEKKRDGRSTIDIDICIREQNHLYDCCLKVADRFGLPEDWINADVMHSDSFSYALFDNAVLYKKV